MSVNNQIASIYKDESSRILAVLTRIFGPHNLEMAEDVLQEAFQKAFTHWETHGVPENPSAWIVKTAKNQAIDIIRANKTKIKFSQDLAQHLESEWSLSQTVEYEFSPSKIKDQQLRMIFMCCHEGIREENRIPFILKNLCGFSIPAISRALVIPPATVKKRLLRTKEKFKSVDFPNTEQMARTIDSVHTILYLLFNEGFHCSDGKQALRGELCQEAIGLLKLLADEPTIVNQDTLALCALMHFHMARIASRTDKEGYNIPIDLQDRNLWNCESIATGQSLLQKAHQMKPGASGRFYIEALIANEHCSAKNFAETNWPAIVNYYTVLEKITGSPIAQLNRAVAIGYAGDTKQAIQYVLSIQDHKILKKSHMPYAVLAHLYALAGDRETAYENAEESKKLGGTPHEQKLMIQQLERLLKRPVSQKTNSAVSRKSE